MNNTEIPARAQRRRYMRYVKSIGSNRHFVRVPMRIGPKTKFLQSTINGTLGDATQKAEEFWLTLAVQRGLKPNEAKRFDSILLNYIEYICRRKSGKNATNIARITNRIIGYLGYIKVKSKILFCQEFERKLQELVAKGETSFHDDIIEFSHAAFKVGMNDGIITFNPIDTSLIIDKASKRKRRTENLSLQEFELLLDSLPYYLWPLIITKWENPSRTKEITENKKSQYAQKGDDKFPVNTGKGGPHRILAIATCLFEFRDSLPPGLDPIATKYENGEYVPIKEFYDDWDIARMR